MRVFLFLAVLSGCVLQLQGAETNATKAKTTIFKTPDAVYSNAKGVKKTSGLVPVTNKYSTGSKSGKSKSKAGKSKSKAGKGKGYANYSAKPNKVVTVNVANCIVGTQVQLVCSSTSTVIQTITISSESNSKCQFAIPPAASITHYYIKVVPATTVYTCDGSCNTYLQTSTTTVTTTIVKKTTKISKTTTTMTGNQSVGKAPTPIKKENTAGIATAKPVMKTTKAPVPAPVKVIAKAPVPAPLQKISEVTGSIKVILFDDENSNGIQEAATDPNLKGLKVTLTQNKKVFGTLTSTCQNNIFSSLAPGQYEVTAEQADGYTCNCKTVVKVTAGQMSTIHMLYVPN